MYVLGMETSGAAASVGIGKDGILKAEYLLNNTRTHSETIMPLCLRLMEDLSLRPEDLGAVAVDIGPGSFTGVRIGVCAANAMGEALQIPVIGVPSLVAMYEGLIAEEKPVCTLLDARNQNIYGALYQNGDCIRQPEAAELKAFLTGLETMGEILFIGDGARAYADLIREQLPNVSFAPEQFDTLRAGYLLSYARRILENGSAGQKQAVPLYLRPSQAERLWARRNA